MRPKARGLPRRFTSTEPHATLIPGMHRPREVIPVTIFALVTVVIVLATRGRLGQKAPDALGSGG